MLKILSATIAIMLVMSTQLIAQTPVRRNYGTELGLPTDSAAREAQLKQMYMDCDKQSQETMLGADEAAYCSMVYETLLNDYFDGDFNSFLEWWKSEKTKP